MASCCQKPLSLTHAPENDEVSDVDGVKAIGSGLVGFRQSVYIYIGRVNGCMPKSFGDGFDVASIGQEIGRG